MRKCNDGRLIQSTIAGCQTAAIYWPKVALLTQHWYCSRTGCVGMGMCCEKMTMIGWRNARSMKLRSRGRPKRTWREVVREDCQARKLNKEDAMDRCKWKKMIKDVRWSGWVWVGECFFWYRPTRVVPDKRPLNGCVCVYRITERESAERYRPVDVARDVVKQDVNVAAASVQVMTCDGHCSAAGTRTNQRPHHTHTRPLSHNNYTVSQKNKAHNSCP